MYYKNILNSLEESTSLPEDVCKIIVEQYYMNPSVYIIQKFMRKLMFTLKNYRKMKHFLFYDPETSNDSLNLMGNFIESPLDNLFLFLDDISAHCECSFCSGFKQTCIVKSLLQKRLLSYYSKSNLKENIINQSYEGYNSFITRQLHFGSRKKIKKNIMKVSKMCVDMGILF